MHGGPREQRDGGTDSRTDPTEAQLKGAEGKPAALQGKAEEDQCLQYGSTADPPAQQVPRPPF